MITTNEMEKIKNLWLGSQHQSESPSSSLKGSGHPGPHMEGFGKIVEGWHCSSQERRLSRDSEAPRLHFLCLITTYPRPTHPVTYQSYPRLISCPKVGTFGYHDHRVKRYSTSDSGSHLRRLVDCRSQRLSSRRTTFPLVQSQKILTQVQRPHSQSSLEDSV